MSNRKNRSPGEHVWKAKVPELVVASNISSVDDIQDFLKETIAEFMENSLDAELDDELGYSKCNYKKEADNSRNSHSSEILCTSFEDMDVSVPCYRNGEFKAQLPKKN